MSETINSPKNVALFQYQADAVSSLSDKFDEILKHDSDKTLSEQDRKTLLQSKGVQLLVAPTGAGKTVIMEFLVDALTEKGRELGTDIAFVFLAPNRLEEQSKDKFEKFKKTNSAGYNVLGKDDVLQESLLQNGDILFLNYASANKKGNRLLKENETRRNLQTLMKNSRDAGVKTVVIVDEAHHSYQAPGAQQLIEIIQPFQTICVTATPDNKLRELAGGDDGGNIHTINREDVINEGIIKKLIRFGENTAAGQAAVKDKNLGHHDNAVQIVSALKQAEFLNKKYEALLSPVRTLVGIQLPPDKKDPYESNQKASKNDLTTVERTLGLLKEYGLKKEEIAIWLADRKENLEGIEEFDSPVKVIIFKYAVALGWDCPRMGVIAYLKDAKGLSLTIQTTGRAMRQPELKEYSDDVLNYAYGYTSFESVSKLIEKYDKEVQFEAPSPLRLREENLDLRSFALPNYFNSRANQTTITMTKAQGLWWNYLLSGGKKLDNDKGDDDINQLRNKIKSVVASAKKPEDVLRSFFPSFQWIAAAKSGNLVGELDADGGKNDTKTEQIDGIGSDIERAYYEGINQVVFDSGMGLSTVDSKDTLGMLLSELHNVLCTRWQMKFTVFQSQFGEKDAEANIGELTRVWTAVVTQIFKNEGRLNNSVFKPKELKTPWRIPETQTVFLDKEGKPQIQKNEDSLYQDAAGDATSLAKFDSENERLFYRNTIPEIVKLLKEPLREDGTEVRAGFLRNGSSNSQNSQENLGIIYHQTDVRDAITYPDWIFIRKDSERLDVFLIETKKEKVDHNSDDPRKTIGLDTPRKAQGFAEYVKNVSEKLTKTNDVLEGEREFHLHACVVNYVNVQKEKSYANLYGANFILDGETGEDTDVSLGSWLKSELKDA